MRAFNLINNFKDMINCDKNRQEYFKNLREYYENANEIVMNEIISNNFNGLNHFSRKKTFGKEQSEFVRNTFFNFNYPQILKSSAIKLYKYTDIKNLVFCAINLRTVDVAEVELENFNDAYGFYDTNINKILYKEPECISHELLHLASTPIVLNQNDYNYSGFRYSHCDVQFGLGLNEGYTEMLSKRIFFDENYKDAYYKTNVYLIRLFELLYDDNKEMENNYFHANYQSPISQFIKYGSIEEFFKLSKYLDFFATTKVKEDEDINMLKFMKNIIIRTGDYDKINLADDFIEEYSEICEKPVKRNIFTFRKKHHFE